MATVVKGEKRGRPGKWLVDYRDAAGIRRILTFNTLARAKDALAIKMQEVRQQTAPVGDPNITVATYAARWLEQVKVTAKPRTHQSYSDMYRLHIAPTFRNVKVRVMQRAHIKTFLVRKLKDNAPATVKLIKAVLSAIMNAAVDDGVILSNPCAGLGRKLKLTRQVSEDDDVQAMTREQVAAFLRAARAKYRSLFLTMARTGIRSGEARALQWGDLDLAGGTARIRRTLSEGIAGTPKGNRARTVDLSPQLVEGLRRLSIQRKAEALRHGWGEVPPWVFITTERAPLDPSWLWREFKRTLEAAKLPGHFKPKSLRHSFASIHLSEGESPVWVQEQLGHASLELTTRVYGRWFPKKPVRGGNDRLDDAHGSKTVANGAGADGMVNAGGHIEIARNATSC
jgi:integrase